MSDTNIEHQQPQSALLRLLEEHSYRRITELPEPDLGLAELRPYPFMAIVGQVEMRTALMLTVINPNVNGVLLIGPRGTGKTTAVRSLGTLLPHIEVSDCDEEVLPEELEELDPEQAEYLYPDCYEKLQRGESISHYESVRLIELPLNARLDDVVGTINEREAISQRTIRIERGILSRADRNILYIDEVNLLDNQIMDAILDASAQGIYTVRRGPVAGTYRSRFVLIGSMNPEEGRLRPQILDRFGLRVTVQGLTSLQERTEIYNRTRAYRQNPSKFIKDWEVATAEAREDIFEAREILRKTTIAPEFVEAGLKLVNELNIESHRAEYTLFEAARAHAAADGRTDVIDLDIRAVAPMALRQRRSEFMISFFNEQAQEDKQIESLVNEYFPVKS